MASSHLQKFFSSANISQNYSSAEKTTATPALLLLSQAGLIASPSGEAKPITTPVHILDNACGTGVLSALLFDNMESQTSRNNIKLTLGDFSDQMIAFASQRGEKNGWSVVEARKLDSQKMDIDNNSFDYVLTNFGYQSMPDAGAALKGTKWLQKRIRCSNVVSLFQNVSGSPNQVERSGSRPGKRLVGCHLSNSLSHGSRTPIFYPRCHL